MVTTIIPNISRQIHFSNLYTTNIFTEPKLNGRILSENTLFTVVFVSHLYHMFVNTRQAAGRGAPVSRDQREHSLSKLNIIMTCAWAVPATCACNSRRWSRCTATQAGRTPRPAAARTPCWGKAPQSLLFFLKEKRKNNFHICPYA